MTVCIYNNNNDKSVGVSPPRTLSGLINKEVMMVAQAGKGFLPGHNGSLSIVLGLRNLAGKKAQIILCRGTLLGKRDSRLNE